MPYSLDSFRYGGQFFPLLLAAVSVSRSYQLKPPAAAAAVLFQRLQLCIQSMRGRPIPLLPFGARSRTMKSQS